MEQIIKSTSEFEAAIKNYSQISLEVDALKSLGNADAHKIMNKSIENRHVAIEHEAFRRLKSFEAKEKATKSKESLQTHRTLEKLYLEKVELEFDKGVEELKSKLRGNSAIYENKVEKQSDEADEGEKVGKKKSENSDDESENENSDEDSDSGSSDEPNTEDESSDNETTDDEDSSEEDEDEEENEDSTENENTEDENTDDEAAPEKIDDSNKQLNAEA